MTESNSTVEKNSELADERHAIANRIEGLISMGPPTCDACYSLDRQDRHEDSEFWPNPLTIFVDVEGDTLAQWMHKTMCDHHNPAIGEGVAVEATHRVRTRPEYVGDEHNHNGAYRYNVLSVKEADW